jgi:two-component system heavy metal sensor histidine kinase CusS
MKLRVPRSIVWRVTLLFMLLSAANFVLMALVIRASVDHHFEHQDQRLLEGKVELVRNILMGWESEADSPRIHRLLKDAMVGHHDLAVKILEPESGFSFESGEDPIPVRIVDGRLQPGSSSFSPINWSDGDSKSRGVIGDVPTGNRGRSMRVVLASDTSHHVEFLNSFDIQLTAICSVALFLTGATSWLATKRGLRALRDMAAVAERISGSRLQDRIQTEMISDELVSLAGSFNAMLDRLSDSLRRLKDFSSDIAHELRTPINNLVTQTQVSLAKTRSNAQYQELLHSNLEEYERIARMIADMLFLAKADNGLIVPRREDVQLSSELQALIEFHEPVASESGVSLACTGEAHVPVDRLMLRRAISNLIDNAIKHTPKGGLITISASKRADHAMISVKNPGDDILDDARARIFDRFYRSSDSRKRNNDDGAGLGLAICASIAQAHGGDVSVISSCGTTEFSLRIPL